MADVIVKNDARYLVVGQLGDIEVLTVSSVSSSVYFFTYKWFGMTCGNIDTQTVIADNPRDALKKFYRAMRLLALGEGWEAVDEVINPENYERINFPTNPLGFELEFQTMPEICRQDLNGFWTRSSLILNEALEIIRGY